MQVETKIAARSFLDGILLNNLTSIQYGGE